MFYVLFIMVYAPECDECYILYIQYSYKRVLLNNVYYVSGMTLYVHL